MVSDGPGLDLRRARRPLVALTVLFAGVLFTGWLAGRLLALSLLGRSVPLASAAIALTGVASALAVLRNAAPTVDALARGAGWALLAAAVLAAADSRWLKRAAPSA